MEYLHHSNNLFNNFQLVGDDILIGTSHESIQTELHQIIEEMYKIKNSPLHWIRCIKTEVVGNSNHRYFIPIPILTNTAFYYYLLELGYYYLKLKYPDKIFKVSFLEPNPYELAIWTNFYKKGENTDLHLHDGVLSGVVYCSTNKISIPTTFENGVDIYGNFGDLCIFPSSLRHENGIYMGDDDRITISFNLAVEKLDDK